jgi:hypothetical protein
MHLGDCARVRVKPNAQIEVIITAETWHKSSPSLSLVNGGTVGLFWNFIVVCFGFATVYAIIAELGSVRDATIFELGELPQG